MADHYALSFQNLHDSVEAFCVVVGKDVVDKGAIAVNVLKDGDGLPARIFKRSECQVVTIMVGLIPTIADSGIAENKFKGLPLLPEVSMSNLTSAWPPLLTKMF